MADVVVVGAEDSPESPPAGQVDASVSERLERHAVELARLEGELRGEIERLHTRISDLQMAQPIVAESPETAAEVAQLEDHVEQLQEQIEEIEDQVGESGGEESPPEPPTPDAPPQRPHILHKRLW